jgi:amino acid transporter
MSHDSLLPSSFQFPDVRKIFLIAVFAVTLLISLISYATSGYFFAFETLAGVVSLSYIMVHMILNAASVKLRKIYGKRIIVISVVSSIFLLSALAYSVAGNILEDPLTDTIMAVVFAWAFIVTLIAALRKDFMLGIKIDSGNEGRAENG